MLHLPSCFPPRCRDEECMQYASTMAPTHAVTGGLCDRLPQHVTAGLAPLSKFRSPARAYHGNQAITLVQCCAASLSKGWCCAYAVNLHLPYLPCSKVVLMLFSFAFSMSMAGCTLAHCAAAALCTSWLNKRIRSDVSL